MKKLLSLFCICCFLIVLFAEQPENSEVESIESPEELTMGLDCYGRVVYY